MRNQWDAEMLIEPETALTIIQEQFPEVEATKIRLLGAGWDNTAFIINDDLPRAVEDINKVIDNKLSLARQEEAREIGQLMLVGIEQHNAENLVPSSQNYAVNE